MAERAARFWELTVPTSDAASEALTNFLWEEGALGVVEEEAPGKRERLRAFFPSTATESSLVGRVATYLEALAALGVAVHGEPRATLLADGDWVEAFRAHFRPLPVGRRFVVAPPWETPAMPGRLLLVIEPGRAFGTGHHGSTAGCVEALETIVETSRPATAIDLGTGSGILAIAAALLGVPRIVAIDTDPDAVTAVAENAPRNGVSDRIEGVVADAATIRVAPAPLVVANLLASAHVTLAARYGELVTPGGTLVLGGILDAEAATVEETLGRHGWAARRALTCEGWTTLVLARDDGDAEAAARHAPRHDPA